MPRLFCPAELQMPAASLCYYEMRKGRPRVRRSDIGAGPAGNSVRLARDHQVRSVFGPGLAREIAAVELIVIGALALDRGRKPRGYRHRVMATRKSCSPFDSRSSSSASRFFLTLDSTSSPTSRTVRSARSFNVSRSKSMTERRLRLGDVRSV